MSVLLIGLGAENTHAVVRRLVAEDDEVRVLERDARSAERWRELGAHIATGPMWDADLIERAAQNVRTIVLGAEHDEHRGEFAAEVVRGGGYARRDMRVVVVGDTTGPESETLRASSLQYVMLTLPRRRWGRGASVDPERLAEAIDAADDLAGSVRLEADLGKAEGWTALLLKPPD